jgi:hypothetical protein
MLANAEQAVRTLSALAIETAQYTNPFEHMTEMALAQGELQTAEQAAQAELRQLAREASREWVANQINNCGLLDREIAATIGMHRSSIKSYRNRLNLPNRGVMSRLAELFVQTQALPAEEHNAFVETALSHAHNPVSKPTGKPPFQIWLQNELAGGSITMARLEELSGLSWGIISHMHTRGVSYTPTRVIALIHSLAEARGLDETAHAAFMRSSLIACRLLPETWPETS